MPLRRSCSLTLKSSFLTRKSRFTSGYPQAVRQARRPRGEQVNTSVYAKVSNSVAIETSKNCSCAMFISARGSTFYSRGKDRSPIVLTLKSRSLREGLVGGHVPASPRWTGGRPQISVVAPQDRYHEPQTIPISIHVRPRDGRAYQEFWASSARGFHAPRVCRS